MNNKNEIIKSGIWYTISNYLIKGLDFITIPIFARLMSVSEYGEYNNFVSCLQLFYVIGSVCVDASFISARFDFKNEIKEYTRTSLLCANISTLIIGFFFILFSNEIENLFSINGFMLVFILLYCFFRPSLDVFQQIERYEYKYKTCVLVSAIVSVVSVFTSLILVIVFKDKLIWRITGTYTPIIIASSVFYFNYIKIKSKFNIKYIKYVFKTCLPYIPHSLAITVLASTDRIMINYYRSTKEVALYSIAYTCSIALSVFSNSLNSSFAPWLGNCINEKQFEPVKRVSKRYLFIFFVPLIFLSIISPEVLLVLGGKKYVEAKYVMPPVLISCFVQFAYSMLVDVEQFAKKTGGMAIASITAAAINICLNYFFIPKYGYIAAAYTTLVSYGVLFSFHYFLICRIGFENIYDMKYMVAVIISISIIICSVSFLYEYVAIRVCLFVGCVLVFTVISLKNYKNLIKWIKGE